MNLHCKHLNDWIVFFPEHVAPCCGELDVAPPKMHFTSETFSMETYQRWIEEVCRLNQTPQGPCRGCRFLVPTENADANIRFGRVTLTNIMLCNAKCSYCNHWKTDPSVKPKYELTGPIKSMIANGYFQEGALFYWAGGEPTIHPEFPHLFPLLRLHGFKQEVLTSGIKFAPELADGLASGEATMQLSLDAGTPETYQAFKGRDVFSRIVENLSKYASGTIAARNITLKYIMSNQNFADKDIDGFIAVCKKLNITNVVLAPELFESKKRDTTSDTIDQMVKFVNRFAVEGLSYNIYYELFSEEYRRMLEGRLAPITSLVGRISGLQNELALTKCAFESRISELRSEHQNELAHTRNTLEGTISALQDELDDRNNRIKEMKKNIGYKIFREMERFKKRVFR